MRQHDGLLAEVRRRVQTPLRELLRDVLGVEARGGQRNDDPRRISSDEVVPLFEAILKRKLPGAAVQRVLASDFRRVENGNFDFDDLQELLGTTCVHPALTTAFFYGCLEAGVRLFDTAAIYGSERHLGNALADAIRDGVVARDDVFIVAKLPPSALYARKPRTTRGYLDSLATTLRLLKTPYVDNLMVHHPGEESEADFKLMWSSMEHAVDRGLARSLGMRSDRLAWGRNNNHVAGLCPDCFLLTTRTPPQLVFIEHSSRTAFAAATNMSQATIALWRRLGIVTMGRRGNVVRNKGEAGGGGGMAEDIFCAEEFGWGPVIWETTSLEHVAENNDGVVRRKRGRGCG